MLKKFQAILQRDSLKEDLDSKFMVIFHNYGASHPLVRWESHSLMTG